MGSLGCNQSSSFDSSSNLQQTGCTLDLASSDSTHPKISTMTEFVYKFLLLVTMLVVITMQPAAVKAVDIQAFDNAGACSGSGFTFSGIAQQVCAQRNSGSFQIRNLASCATGRVYRNGGCSTSVLSGNGPNVRCFVGGSFTGAAWFNGCRRRRLQGADADRCSSTAVPNGVHYTKDSSTGSWILKTPNATDVLAQLMDVDDAEKVNWLKALGAYHAA